jgi:CPA1 family monovalent cation:H+ antiporter
MLRAVYRQRLQAPAGDVGDPGGAEDADDADTPEPSVDGAYAALALAAIGSERAVLLRLRDEQRIDDEVLAELQRRLDLEEILLHEELPG